MDFTESQLRLIIRDEVRGVINEHVTLCRIGEVKNELWGNGKEGLKTRIERIETEKKTSYSLLTAIGAGIIAISSLIASIWRH